MNKFFIDSTFILALKKEKKKRLGFFIKMLKTSPVRVPMTSQWCHLSRCQGEGESELVPAASGAHAPEFSITEPFCSLRQTTPIPRDRVGFGSTEK